MAANICFKPKGSCQKCPQMTTLTVSAESEADAIDTALEMAGRAFENRVLLVKRV